jgi:type IV fimbrial biogenesis protein FimT
MLSLRQAGSAGYTLIELLIGLAVLGIVLMIGLPGLATWMQNTQIRTSAEAVSSGVQLARAEALRRNTSVRFQLVNSLTAACALSNSGASWVISLESAAAKCDVSPSDTTSPMTIQKRAGDDGSPNAVIAAIGGTSPSVIFNGLGRAIAGSVTQIDITNPTGGACKTAAGNEPMRCLQIRISAGGQVKMCDPAVTAATDPRICI